VRPSSPGRPLSGRKRPEYDGKAQKEHGEGGGDDDGVLPAKDVVDPYGNEAREEEVGGHEREKRPSRGHVQGEAEELGEEVKDDGDPRYGGHDPDVEEDRLDVGDIEPEVGEARELLVVKEDVVHAGKAEDPDVEEKEPAHH